jgi:hypothetical protein
MRATTMKRATEGLPMELEARMSEHDGAISA